jgi:hypothetical protein
MRKIPARAAWIVEPELPKYSYPARVGGIVVDKAFSSNLLK